jgi:hypothetical protein
MSTDAHYLLHSAQGCLSLSRDWGWGGSGGGGEVKFRHWDGQHFLNFPFPIYLQGRLSSSHLLTCRVSFPPFPIPISRVSFPASYLSPIFRVPFLIFIILYRISFPSHFSTCIVSFPLVSLSLFQSFLSAFPSHS